MNVLAINIFLQQIVFEKFWMNFQMKLVSQGLINYIFIDYDPAILN